MSTTIEQTAEEFYAITVERDSEAGNLRICREEGSLPDQTTKLNAHRLALQEIAAHANYLWVTVTAYRNRLATYLIEFGCMPAQRT